jgi:uncharacterized protein (TIGR01777 family)
MKNILITGGSGLVGKAITQTLEKKGYQVAWLSRSSQNKKSFLWDVEKQEIDQNAIEWSDAIIHLAGSGVAEKRWTSERKKDILKSRTESTRLLWKAIQKATKKPEAFISASAVGFYGFDTGETLKTEDAQPGNDFLAEVVVAWEMEVEKIEALGVRTAILRIGIVLDKIGGALSEILKPPVAAPLGSGNQWMSWIHIQDLAKLFVFALENPEMKGKFNAVAPNPVKNKKLTRDAAKAKGKAFLGIGVPEFVIKLILGEMAAMVLGGNRVSAEKTLETNFQFEFPSLDLALKDLF